MTVITLLQKTSEQSTQSYADWPSVDRALDALIEGFEGALRDLNPGVTSVTYDAADLVDYISGLYDVRMLV